MAEGRRTTCNWTTTTEQPRGPRGPGCAGRTSFVGSGFRARQDACKKNGARKKSHSKHALRFVLASTQFACSPGGSNDEAANPGPVLRVPGNGPRGSARLRPAVTDGLAASHPHGKRDRTGYTIVHDLNTRWFRRRAAHTVHRIFRRWLSLTSIMCRVAKQTQAHDQTTAQKACKRCVDHGYATRS